MDRRSFLALAAAMPLAWLAGCGGSSATDAAKDAQAIKDALDAQLGPLATGSGDTAEELKQKIRDAAGTVLDELGVDLDGLVVRYMDAYSYELGDVSVTGSTATAKVSVTCRSIPSIVDAFTQANGKTSEDLYDAMATVEPSKHELAVNASKGSDGSWDVKDSLVQELETLVVVR